MRIGINGRFLVAKRTGVQRAAYNLLRSIINIDRKNEYFIFTGSNQLDNPELKYDHVHIVASKLRQGESIRNHFWEQWVLPQQAAKFNIDVLHSPANMAPLFYKGPSVVHIHDLCFVVNPHWYSPSFRTLYKIVIPRLAKRASYVITNSNNSRNDLLQFCDLDAKRIKLIYWAVDDLFLTQQSLEPSKPPFNHPESFILYVGSLEPRKNIHTLVEAYESLRAQHPQMKTKLILIGGESPLFGAVRLKAKDYHDDVIFKGFVTDQELATYYKKASLLVYPSLYEGFGLPPLEAMASGTPVVTSNISSIPEVVGQGAYLVNPYDKEELTQAIFNVLTQPTLRQKLIENGYQQVQKFNWTRIARDTVRVYYEAYYSAQCDDFNTYHLPLSDWENLQQLGRPFKTI